MTSENNSGGFSFGFFNAGETDVVAKHDDDGEKGSIPDGGGFTFGFSLPTMGDNTTVAANPIVTTGNNEDNDRKVSTTSMVDVDGNNNKQISKQYSHHRHRGMFMPNDIVDTMVESIFYNECNDKSIK